MCETRFTTETQFVVRESTHELYDPNLVTLPIGCMTKRGITFTLIACAKLTYPINVFYSLQVVQRDKKPSECCERDTRMFRKLIKKHPIDPEQSIEIKRKLHRQLVERKLEIQKQALQGESEHTNTISQIDTHDDLLERKEKGAVMCKKLVKILTNDGRCPPALVESIPVMMEKCLDTKADGLVATFRQMLKCVHSIIHGKVSVNTAYFLRNNILHIDLQPRSIQDFVAAKMYISDYDNDDDNDETYDDDFYGNILGVYCRSKIHGINKGYAEIMCNQEIVYDFELSL